ncbi:MAG: hypothetical protein QM478_04505 [Flavobacteriaceae bacterium]
MTTKRIPLYRIIASILAIMLGLMTVFAGSKVLLEIDIKNYNVLIWLVSYNIIFGAISIVVAYFIFKNLKHAKQWVLFVLAMHFIVLLYLKFFSTEVALESVKAMTFRVGIWIFIVLFYMVFPKIFNKHNKIN